MNTRMQGLVLWTSEKQLRDERHIHTHTHAYTLAPKTAGQIVDRVNGYTYKNVFHTFFFQSIYFIPFGQLNVTNWLYTCRWVWRHLSSSSVQKMSVYRWRSHMLHKRWPQGVPMRNIFSGVLEGHDSPSSTSNVCQHGWRLVSGILCRSRKERAGKCLPATSMTGSWRGSWRQHSGSSNGTVTSALSVALALYTDTSSGYRP